MIECKFGKYLNNVSMNPTHNKLAHATPTEAWDVLSVNCMVAYTTWRTHIACVDLERWLCTLSEMNTKCSARKMQSRL